jgi:hypothetical protein
MSSHHLKIPHEGLFVILIILGLFLLAMLCLAGLMNPRELLDCSLFRCCWRRRDDAEMVQHSYPTIDEYIFDSTSGEAGFVAMQDANDDEEQQLLTMNNIFPDLLGQQEEEEEE